MKNYFKSIVENPSISENDFRILNLKVIENPFLGDLDIDFVDTKDEPEESPYSTIVIGPNGTGKSNILRSVIHIFRELNEYKRTGKRLNEIQGNFRIVFSIGKQQVFQFGNIVESRSDSSIKLEGKTPGKVLLEKYDQQGFRLIEPEEVELPKSIVASSIMLTDKFPVLKNDTDFDIYNYLGVRRSPNVAGTRTYVRRTVDHLVARIDDPEFIDRLTDILDFLDLEQSLKVQYHPKYQKLLFNNELTIDGFHRFFDKEKTHPNRETDLWGKDHYERIKDDRERLYEIVTFCNRLSQRLVKVGPRKKSIQFDLIQDRSIKGDYTILKDLDALDFISYPTVILKNKDSDYTLNESSSGEYHLISTLIGILSTIKQGSLVLIDEPEISLHPNWQMKYMYYIRQLFKEYKSCHFVLATHSHFLVSDLVDSNSCIIGLSRDEKISAKTIKTDTFGWSAEQTLLDVFKVPTTRNYYVADRIGEILNEIAKAEEKDERYIKVRVRDLKNYNLENLSKEDPLKEIVDKLLEKYG